MPLVSCPDCYAEVSDMAPTCPRCGRPLRAPPVMAQPYQPPQPVYVDRVAGVVRTRPATSPVTWGCTGLLVLAVLWAIFAAAAK